MSALEPITVVPIGVVRGGRAAAEDDAWAAEVSTIELDGRFTADALAGLTDFSHVEVVFHFHGIALADVATGRRHPRGRTAWPAVGIFAQRGRNRPNRLAVSIAELLAVDGTTVTVRGLDAIDGTPVLDLKPVLSGFLPRGAVREPAWARELMASYW
jgi:tRNA (Thr-GGU) A37 N-methylase